MLSKLILEFAGRDTMLFSQRFRQAIFEKKMRVTLPTRLRRRLWLEIKDYEHRYWYRPEPYDDYRAQTTTHKEVTRQLLKVYGQEQLLGGTDLLASYKDLNLVDPDEERDEIPVDLQGFILGAYPAQVMDVIEMMDIVLDEWSEPEYLSRFRTAINAIFYEEESPWQLLDGEMFRLDMEFLRELFRTAEKDMRRAGFDGALDEFRKARRDVGAKRIRGAVHNAANSLESTVKTILGRDDGNARVLFRALIAEGYFDALPEHKRKGFTDNVLGALPYLRNNHGGHGQGEEVENLPAHLGDLAVNLCAVFFHFLFAEYQNKLDEGEEEAAPANDLDDFVDDLDISDDDIPF